MFGPYADRFWKVNLNPLALECKITGNRIIFRGVKDQRQREKVKSITFKNGKLVWIWCEEATELLSEDVDILDDRLRGNLNELNPNLYYQITMTLFCILPPVIRRRYCRGSFLQSYARQEGLHRYRPDRTVSRYSPGRYSQTFRNRLKKTVILSLNRQSNAKSSCATS